jgi:TIR domain
VGDVSDIFISYAREDRPAAQSLAEKLQNQGWSVWWDRHLLTGDDFDKVIAKELLDARCVIVLWSKLSVESQYVRDEAAEAQDNKKLVPVLIDDTRPPLGFRRTVTAQLLNWNAPDASWEFEVLLSALTALLGAPPRVGENPRALPPPSPKKATVRGVVALALSSIKIKVALSITVGALAVFVTTVHYWDRGGPARPELEQPRTRPELEQPRPPASRRDLAEEQADRERAAGALAVRAAVVAVDPQAGPAKADKEVELKTKGIDDIKKYESDLKVSADGEPVNFKVKDGKLMVMLRARPDGKPRDVVLRLWLGPVLVNGQVVYQYR